MGKNKNGGSKGKKQNVFKLAGAKSLKAKAKAKAVTGNLKKINEIVRKNVGKVDRQFVDLKNDITMKKPELPKKEVNVKKLPKEPVLTEQDKLDTLKKFSDMQF